MPCSAQTATTNSSPSAFLPAATSASIRACRNSLRGEQRHLSKCMAVVSAVSGSHTRQVHAVVSVGGTGYSPLWSEFTIAMLLTPPAKRPG
jgi:hypothetical protein